jgi:hypothetical protein
MAVGQVWVVQLHNDGMGGQKLDSIEFVPFEDSNQLIVGSAVQLLAYHTNGDYNAFIVKLIYPIDAIPSTAQMLSTIIADCVTAITNTLGAGVLLV